MTTTSILKMLAAIPKQDREALRNAYDALAVFAHDMARVQMAEIELETPSEFSGGREYWQVELKDALGDAAVAMQKVPIKWIAILDVVVE